MPGISQVTRNSSFAEVLATATPKTLFGALGKVVSSEFAEEVPSAVTPLIARTLNLTFEPLAKALNFTLKVVEFTVWVRPEFASVTTYEVMPAPPSDAGAAHRTVTSSREFECVGFAGVDGEVIGEAVTAEDQELIAEVDTARILKE